MQPYYEKFQTVQIRDSSEHSLTPSSANGPVQASYPRRRNKLQMTWEETFKALNAFHSNYATDGQAIGGTATTNAIDGRDGKGERSHAGKAYLEPARDRDNLEVVTGAFAKKILFDASNGKLRATGVLYEINGELFSAEAKQEVVLCAGVFGSPQILEVSGIGDSDILERAGVKCLLHIPGVGGKIWTVQFWGTR